MMKDEPRFQKLVVDYKEHEVCYVFGTKTLDPVLTFCRIVRRNGEEDSED